MKRIGNYFKKNGVEILTIAIFLIVFSLLFFHSHIERLWLSIKAFFEVIVYSFKVVFLHQEEVPAPSTAYDILLEVKGEGSIFNLLSLDFQAFLERLKMVGHLLITKSFWKDFANVLANGLNGFVLFLDFLFLFALAALFFKLRRKYKPDDKAEDTRFLSAYKRVRNRILLFLRKGKDFVLKHYSKKMIITMIILIAAYMQLFTISIDFLANYYLFTADFDFNVIWKGIVLLLVDFLPAYFSIPFIFRIAFLYFLFDRLRLKAANARLRKYADIDIDYLDQSGNQILINGASRAGKNALATTLAVLYVQEWLPQHLLEIMQEVERKFPFVNYAELRSYIELKKDYGLLKNQLDIYVDFMERKEKYDVEKDPSIFFLDPNEKNAVWDELTIESIDHALCDWALAFFFYSSSPLSVSNYGISFNSPSNPKEHYFNYVDVDEMDALQETRDDFQKRELNRVINYDFLRQGKRFQNYYGDPTRFYVPDVGLYTITEIGKERGSSESVKKADGSSDKVNQKNDKFRERLQIWSHAATIRFQTLFKVIADEQRNLGLNAETRATFESIILIDRRKLKKSIALKGWIIESTICKWILNKYDEYALHRSELEQNQSLRNYLLKKIIKPINLYFLRRANKYSYTEIRVYASNGSVEGVSDDVEQKKLYILNKIAYSGRYETANLKKLFLNEMANSRLSFSDQRKFQTLAPSPSDYEAMNSFAYKDLFNKEKKEKG